MSRSCELTVEITGRSVHLARFAEGCDALDAACRLLTRLYALAEGKPLPAALRQNGKRQRPATP